MSKWYSVNELAKETGIAEPSLRRYISNFQPYFISKGGSRAKKYDPSAISILKRIKQLFDEGYETDGVREVIKQEFPVIMSDDEMAKTDGNPMAPTLATSEDVAELEKSLLAKMDERFSRQEEGIALIIQKLEQRERQIEEREQRLEKREQLLLEEMAEKEEQKEVAVKPPEEEKKGFWKKFFK